MRLPSFRFPFIIAKKESKFDKELKKTFKQRTIELYKEADQKLPDCIREWRKGEAQRKEWFLPDMKELVSLDITLPKSTLGKQNLDRVMLAAAYAMEMTTNEFREQIYYTREVIRKLVKENGKNFFDRTPNEIVEYFASKPFETISEKQTKGFLFFQ